MSCADPNCLDNWHTPPDGAATACPTPDAPVADTTPKPARGRKPGQTLRRLVKRAGDPVRMRHFRLYESEFNRLARIGDGNATAGLLRLIAFAEKIGKG